MTWHVGDLPDSNVIPFPVQPRIAAASAAAPQPEPQPPAPPKKPRKPRAKAARPAAPKNPTDDEVAKLCSQMTALPAQPPVEETRTQRDDTSPNPPPVPDRPQVDHQPFYGLPIDVLPPARAPVAYNPPPAAYPSRWAHDFDQVEHPVPNWVALTWIISTFALAYVSGCYILFGNWLPESPFSGLREPNLLTALAKVGIIGAGWTAIIFLSAVIGGKLTKHTTSALPIRRDAIADFIETQNFGSAEFSTPAATLNRALTGSHGNFRPRFEE
jgi:hypothetical protein